MALNKPDRPVFDPFELILAAMGITLALFAVGYAVSHYQHIFGHMPY